MMGKSFSVVVVLISLLAHAACAQDIKIPETTKYPDHPRILLLKGEEESIREGLKSQPVWSKMNAAIITESNHIIDLPLLERIQIGRRLLGKSRECIRRVFYLSYAWRMTGEKKYADRAEKEMLNVSQFSDWNPSHFLDVAEMTMALSIGYDWLYDVLPTESRKMISNAILKKGLTPSLIEEYNWFLKANHNWNQVCNAGMVYGALAIAEDQPALSAQIINRALSTIHLPMEEYKPDGAYPEGYSYWDYGTSFNVMFISAIEKVFSTDFGLSATPGFLNTSGFLENMTAPSGLSFNWGDCGVGGGLKPAMFWFAQKKNDPSILWVEKRYLERNDFSTFTQDRLLPAIMIWNKNLALDKVVAPESKVWVGQGDNPVALLRTSWTDPNGIYVGFKAGAASVNHGHMDIGSFIMEANGVRWASDLGSQDYESLESKGIQVFGRTQDAQRWSIFRINNYAHNTLTVDNQLQLVKGYAKIDAHSDHPGFIYAISDLSTVYENQLASVKRGVSIVKSKYVAIRDELTTTDKQSTVQWRMLTGAEVMITGENTATLVKDNQKLFLKVISTSAVTMKTWSTAPVTSYDAPNPGTTLVGFELVLPAKTSAQFTVLLIPEKASKEATVKIKSLKEWNP
jgi:hypothetical protein